MTTLDELPLREHLRGKKPYGPPRHDVPVLLNSNENTHPVAESVAGEVVAAVERAMHGVNRYPDDSVTELRDELAGYLGHGLTRDQLWAANGSNEILQEFLQAFGGDGRSLLSFEPSYSMYPILAANNSTRFVAVERDTDFELSPATAVAAVGRVKPEIVFLCSPNNPTGTPLSLETVEAVYDASDGMVLVDEAYAEFLPEGELSALTLLPGRPRLVVSRTLSKAFAFAGVRLGYLAADPAVIDALRLVRLPYHLSSLTQAAAIAALRHAEVLLEPVHDIVEQRDRIVRVLADLGFRPYRSGSNFVLFGGVGDAEAAFRRLVAGGVLVRPSNLPGHLRVTAGTETETTAFLDIMAEIAGSRG